MTAPNPLAFRFGRLLADPAFRRRLDEGGWTNGMTVYPAQPGETYAQVRARMEPGRHLLAIPDPDAPFGLWMMVCEIG